MVDIKGLDKARVLKALYDNSHAQGTAFFQSVPSGIVTVEYCEKLLKKTTRFDYLYGRVLKIDISGDAFDERLYDRDCGEGAAQRAVDSIRAEQRNDTDGEKKELTMEEKVKLTKEALEKIVRILAELPPDVYVTTTVALKPILPGLGPMEGMAGMMMGGPLTPPMGGRFGGPFQFPHDIFSMGRNG